MSSTPTEQCVSLPRTGCQLVLYARSSSLLGRNVVYCDERFNCSVNDIIYGRLPIIINSVHNSVDDSTLDRVAFLRELIMIRNSSLTLIIRLVI